MNFTASQQTTILKAIRGDYPVEFTRELSRRDLDALINEYGNKLFPPKPTAKDRRTAAVKAIVDAYYIPDTPERTDELFDLEILRDRFNDLKALGKTDAWQKGIDKAVWCVDYAWESMMKENGWTRESLGLFDIVGIPNEEAFTSLTAIQYAEKFHWALFQGIFYVTDI